MRKRGTAKNYVTASELAAYAANPEQFIKRKGKAINPEAAKAGTSCHSEIGKNPSLITLLIPLLITGLGLVAWILYYFFL